MAMEDSVAQAASIPTRDEWDRLVSAWRETAVADQELNCRWEAADDAGKRAIDEEWNRAGEVECDAGWRWAMLPAPDLQALALKLEWLFGERNGDEGACWNAKIMTSIRADWRRLLPREAELSQFMGASR